jgi:hypothetical protein
LTSVLTFITTWPLAQDLFFLTEVLCRVSFPGALCRVSFSRGTALEFRSPKSNYQQFLFSKNIATDFFLLGVTPRDSFLLRNSDPYLLFSRSIKQRLLSSLKNKQGFLSSKINAHNNLPCFQEHGAGIL